MELPTFNYANSGQTTYLSFTQVDVAKQQISATPVEAPARVKSPTNSRIQPKASVEKYSAPATLQTQRQYSTYQRQPEHLRQDWTTRVIEAQAARVTGFNNDAIELKPITIESRPSDNIRLFKDIANNGYQHQVIDVYV